MRKKRALDIEDLPKDASEREGPATAEPAAKPVEDDKQESEEESEDDDSSDDDALGGLSLIHI